MPGKNEHVGDGLLYGIIICMVVLFIITGINSIGIIQSSGMLVLCLISFVWTIIGTRMPDFDWSPSWNTKNPLSGNKKLIIFYGLIISLMLFSPVIVIDIAVYASLVISSMIVFIIIAIYAQHRGWFHTTTIMVVLSLLTGISVANAVFGFPNMSMFLIDHSQPVLSWFIYMFIVSISTAVGYYLHLRADNHVHMTPPKRRRYRGD